MQDGYTALILEHYYGLDNEAQDFYDSNAENGPLGQTEDADGPIYYGTRGALGVSAAATGAVVARGAVAAARGEEIMVSGGSRARIAPVGNRTGHPTGKYPHYHREVPDPSKPGHSLPGQSRHRHRPWDIKADDGSFWDRF